MSRFFLAGTAFFDACFLAGEFAQVVEFGTTYLTTLVHFDSIDERAVDGEDTLHADVVAHFTNGEALVVAFAADADNNAAVLLDTFFVAFLDAVGHGDGVAGTKFGMCLAGGESLFGNFN